MSDCFDHMFDAYDQLFHREMDFESYGEGNGRPFAANPNFYHTFKEFKALVTQTEIAYLFKISKHKGVWVPKSICRRLETTKKGKIRVYVHRYTFVNFCSEVRLENILDEFEVL